MMEQTQLEELSQQRLLESGSPAFYDLIDSFFLAYLSHGERDYAFRGGRLERGLLIQKGRLIVIGLLFFFYYID